MKHRGEHWSSEEIEQLKNLYSQGVKIVEISSIIQRSESAIQKKLKEFGLINRKNDWTEEEMNKLKELVLAEMKYSEIANILEKTERSCQGKAVRLGLKKKNCNVWENNKRTDFWSEKEIEELKKCVINNYSAKQISEKLGRSLKSVFYQLKKQKLHISEKTFSEASNYRRVYKVDDNYFENIDTQMKAYFLGWLITDGWVSGEIKTKRGTVRLNKISLKLEISDLDVIEVFKQELKTDSPIKFRKARKTKEYVNKFTGKKFSVSSHEQCSLEVTSAKMKKDLEKYGIVPHKTYTVIFPKRLDEKYYPGFIAGVLSGDGSVDVKKNHNTGTILRSSICGTENLLTGIQKILIKNIDYNSQKRIRKSNDSEHLFILELNQTETINLYMWLKNNGISLMSRKNKIIEEYVLLKSELIKKIT